jgi:Outer membrane protein beta-barrel domain
MKKILSLITLCGFSFISNAQVSLGIGIKAGLNFANVKDASGFNTNNRTGYMIGGFIAPGKKKLIGFRSEIILSRQGYNYKTSSNTGIVNLDYLLLPQLLTINFSKLVQIHAGGQIAFLLNANVDSTGSGSGSLFNYFNRFDYGLAAGAEIYPFKGLFIGGRINVSLNNVNKEAPLGGNWPNFIPRVDAKNNVVQVYTGWRF